MSFERYAHLVSFAISQPWALTPDMVQIIAGIFGRRLAGKGSDPEAIEAAVAARRDNPQPRRGNVGIIPVYGVLAPRANMISEASGGTSYEKLGAQLREAMARDDIKTIVLDVDSPGGSVAGATEFAAQLRAARAIKPIIAVANHKMASAAYWLGANATKVYASPSAQVGSIGVLTIHEDLSAALAREGITRTILSAGKYKAQIHDSAPLSDEGRAYLEGMLANSYGRFVGDVAKGRGVSVAAVKGGYGEGHVLDADDALAAGMVDKIATLDDTVASLTGSTSSADARAALELTDTSHDHAAIGRSDTEHDPGLAAPHAQQTALARALLELTLTD